MAISRENAQSHHPVIDRYRADSAWERAQERALQAFTANKPAEARAHWARALDIAERCFERGDPRLAASLSNHGYALLRLQQIHQANTYFRRADAAWEDSWCWVPWMTPPKGRDGNEPASYGRGDQEAFYALINQGRKITGKLRREHRLSDAIGDDWSAVKPKGMTDIRRLFSAIYLMPTGRHGRSGSGGARRVA